MNIWTIAGEDRDTIIESVVNTVLGMSLVTGVTILPIARERVGEITWLWDVHLIGDNGDIGIIHSSDEDVAIQLANDIGDAVNAAIADLPSFGMHHPIRVGRVDGIAS